MKLQICARCKKRPAMVFITRLENEKSINEGLCLQCASELGIKPVNDMLSKMGIDEDAIRAMSSEINEMLESSDMALEQSDPSDSNDPRTPTFNLGELFGMAGRPHATKNDPKGKPDGKKEQSRKALNAYCTNLNERARAGKIDKIVGRDREIDRMIQILSRRQKNNPCLIGEPGVGKTAIVEELAQRIVDARVPQALVGCEICNSRHVDSNNADRTGGFTASEESA